MSLSSKEKAYFIDDLLLFTHRIIHKQSYIIIYFPYSWVSSALIKPKNPIWISSLGPRFRAGIHYGSYRYFSTFQRQVYSSHCCLSLLWSSTTIDSKRFGRLEWRLILHLLGLSKEPKAYSRIWWCWIRWRNLDRTRALVQEVLRRGKRKP